MTYSRRTWLLTAGSAAAARGADPAYFPPPEAEGGWRRGTAGADIPTIDRAFDLIQRSSKNGGLLVVRRGSLIYERYFGLGHPEATPNLASCGKSFTSVAVGMLLYAALWLNARSNISEFMKELRAQMEGALGRGSMAGLFLIAFSAVLRESFETALFLQGLSIDSPTGAAWGGVAGLVALTGLVLAVNRVGYRLPMKSLFRWSTVLLFATAVMLLGKGLHALQEVGVVPIRPIPMITVDFLGIYPDLVSLLPQLLLALSPLAWKLIRRGGPNDSTAVPATE